MTTPCPVLQPPASPILRRQGAALPGGLTGRAIRLSAWVALTFLTLALARIVWTHNLERACVLEQWPVLPACVRGVADAPAHARFLREQAARNPGDSQAWIDLAALTGQSDQSPDLLPASSHGAVLDTATGLAEEDHRVQRLQAARAIRQEQWPQAVQWLARLVQDNSDWEATVTLAVLAAQPQALAAMQAQLKPGDRWLGPVLQAMPQVDMPVATAMPLLTVALAQQDLPPELFNWLLRRLQAEGQWPQAHALWRYQLGQPVAPLFNGDFDQGFLDNGFDWEVTPAPPSSAGARVRQVAVDAHRGVLQVGFTGRPVAVPVVRQVLVLTGRRYVLSGQFMTRRLRSDQGLAWTLQCLADEGRETARTPALRDTAGQWQAFTIAFELAPGCGPAVVLGLHTFAPYEALAGLHGEASFDDFRLEALP